MTLPRRTVLLLLTLMVVLSLITWLDLTFNPIYITGDQTWLPVVAMRSDLLGFLVFAGLLIAYWRYGWEAVRISTVIGMTLLVGFTTPEPFVSHYGAMGVFLPPVVALVLTNSSGVVLSTVAVLGIFIARAGGQGVYTQPLALSIIAEVVGGMLLSRGLLRHTQRRLAAQAVELEQQRDALRESEQLHRLIAEHTHDLISLLDANGRFRYLSPSYAAVLGYDPPTLLGRSPRELLHPDDAARAPEAWQQLTTQGRHRSLIRVRHAGGTWRWCEVSDATFVRDGVPYVASVARDVTEAKQLEAQLRQSQKMEAIGRLAGGVAHDFNNLLTAISGYIDLALRDTALSVQLRADLSVITEATERAARLTSQLLAFARKQIIDPQLVDLNDLLRAMERLLRPLLGADVALLLRLTADLPAITADPGQIEQIVVNLAVNARDAMPQGGTLRIETALMVLDDDAARKQGGVQPGRYVQLAVSDTGSGMSAEVQSHIFEPFFTTKEPGKGTGLGLATCYGIVEQHGGHIAVASAVGHGTTISISFPALAAPVAAAQSPHADAPPLPGGSETVLLVEDEAAVRTLAVRVLTAQGYTVLEAGNGVEALRVAQAYDGTIDLVVTDVVMPQLGGPALVEQLVQTHPTLKTMYISGYNDDTVITQGRREHTIVFLQKPFSLDALLRTIREVLDGATQQIILGE